MKPWLPKLLALRLDEADFDESFCRSSGPGGQNVNKVSTAVELCHRPTELRVKAQEARTQGQNREIAWNRLIDLIAQKRRNLILEKKSAREKVRRQNRPRPRALKRKMTESKRHRAKIKAGRGRSQED
ncbi:MAG: peptide chain release factor-like protein [Blastochloris sp.]|nr:peptide chain release factor-like protein [Blastochloris sp.]